MKRIVTPSSLLLFVVLLTAACTETITPLPESEPIELQALDKTLVVRGIHSYNPDDLPGLIWCDPGSSVCYVWVIAEAGVNGHPKGIYMPGVNDAIVTLAGAVVDATNANGDATEVHITAPNPKASYAGSWSHFLTEL